MKVYVDELPECCNECPCCNNDVDYGSCCNLGAYEYEDYYQTLYKHPRCPLQSLADHDKQVRKEVVEEIRDKLKDMDFLAHETELGERIDCFSKYKVLDILIRIEDQIQGENNCQN